MKKMIIIAALTLISIAGFSQVTGKFMQYKYITDATISDTTYYPVQVDGRNYTWQLWSSWADSSVITTSTVGIQTSKDGIRWAWYADMAIKDMTDLNGEGVFEDGILPGTWLRFVFRIASGDVIYGLSCTYTFKQNAQ